MEVFYGILIPFLGTALGASCVFFMKKSLNGGIQRILAGFAAGVMVAASIWSLLIPAMNQSHSMGRLSFIPAAAGLWRGIRGLSYRQRRDNRRRRHAVRGVRVAYPSPRHASSLAIILSSMPPSSWFTVWNFPP